jgi:hypothetical protein
VKRQSVWKYTRFRDRVEGHATFFRLGFFAGTGIIIAFLPNHSNSQFAQLHESLVPQSAMESRYKSTLDRIVPPLTMLVVLLGDSGVGKSTLMSRLLHKQLYASGPTLGCSLACEDMQIEGTTARLALWDTGTLLLLLLFLTPGSWSGALFCVDASILPWCQSRFDSFRPHRTRQS